MFDYTHASNRASKTFYSLLILSVIIHIFIIFKFQWDKSIELPKEELIEVDLLKILEPAPPKKTTTHNYKSPINQKTVSRTSSGKSVPKTEEKATVRVKKPSPPIQAPLPPKIEKPVLNVQSKLIEFKDTTEADQGVSLSQKQLEIPRLDTTKLREDPKPSTIPTADNPLQSTPLRKTPKQQSADLKNVDIGKLISKDVVTEAKTPVISDSSKSQSDKVTGRQIIGIGDQKIESGYQEGVTIEGEISKRKVIYKPSPPELNIDRDVTVVLKFTVLPNGEVDQVFPFQKADPELERLAMEMLHKYRFEPLFGSNLVQEGIIRFIIYRKTN